MKHSRLPTQRRKNSRQSLILIIAKQKGVVVYPMSVECHRAANTCRANPHGRIRTRHGRKDGSPNPQNDISHPTSLTRPSRRFVPSADLFAESERMRLRSLRHHMAFSADGIEGKATGAKCKVTGTARRITGQIEVIIKRIIRKYWKKVIRKTSPKIDRSRPSPFLALTSFNECNIYPIPSKRCLSPVSTPSVSIYHLNFESKLLQVFVVLHVLLDGLLNQVRAFFTVFLGPLFVELLVGLGVFLLASVSQCPIPNSTSLGHIASPCSSSPPPPPFLHSLACKKIAGPCNV